MTNVYLDLQGGLPTLWDSPGGGRSEMVATVKDGNVVSILSEEAIAALRILVAPLTTLSEYEEAAAKVAAII